MIPVRSLSRLHETVEATGARHVVTLLKDVERVQRPGGISAENHLVLGMDDITGPLEGYIAPAHEHVTRLIAFVRGWDRAAPLVMHCYAGISRSTAGAYVAACALNPRRDERAIARKLRLAPPTATPNFRIAALGDRAPAAGGPQSPGTEELRPGARPFQAGPVRPRRE